MKKQDTYHHGNLREALLGAARTILQESGVESLTLREVARRAGVSTAAPYYHFADKAALVSALVQQDLDALERASRDAMEGIADPQAKLEAIGVAYVLYAVDHPAEFRLMFRPELGSLLEVGDAADAPLFCVLLEVIDDLRAARRSTGDRMTAVITAWSLVHGLAALLVDGPLTFMSKDRDQVRALATQVTNNIMILG